MGWAATTSTGSSSRSPRPSRWAPTWTALNHLQVGDRTYNGHRLADIVEDHGTNRLGIDTLPQVVTRGLLLDVAAVRGVDRLGARRRDHAVDDAETALDRAGLAVRPGDAVLFHTGWGALWGVDNDRVRRGRAGPGMALAEWLVEHRVALTGCDTWSFGPLPAEDPDDPFVVPQTLNTRHGVVVRGEPAACRGGRRRAAASSCFVVSHAKLRGATGAWVAPLAIV